VAGRSRRPAVIARRRPWIPNVVTFLRAALVPPLLVLLSVAREVPPARWWALGVFLVAALTDTLDGWAARRWQGVTAFGAMADPLADKLLIVGALVSLALVGDAPWWVVVVVAAREAAVTGLRVLVVRRAGVVVPASPWGKLKTVAQMVAIGVAILPGAPAGAVAALYLAAVVLTVGSGVDYAVRMRAPLRAARAGVASTAGTGDASIAA
jgi:CDP-diacylglycerol--glycerol-3-phosphate 3-phosphatidyltransferase